jgi:hypothetical protein
MKVNKFNSRTATEAESTFNIMADSTIVFFEEDIFTSIRSGCCARSDFFVPVFFKFKVEESIADILEVSDTSA